MSSKQKASIILFILALLLGGLGFSDADTGKILSQVESRLIQVQPGQYQVVSVVDGDTLFVRGTNGHEDKVRFIGIDTPEKNHPSKPVQCFAEAASQHLADLIGDSDVKLEADPTNTNRDRYDRLLRYVYLPDGTLLNAKMIEDGYAFAYLSFPYTKMDEFKDLERQARQGDRGLWSECDVELDNGYLNTNPV